MYASSCAARNHDVVLNGAHGQMLHYFIYKVLDFVVTYDVYFPSHSSVDIFFSLGLLIHEVCFLDHTQRHTTVGRIPLDE
jgi:hypothetical protein